MDHDQHIDDMFDANSKSVGTAYLLWFFFGLLGVHRFYAGKTKSGVVRLLLWLIPFIGWALLALLWIIDLFLIPSMIGEQNLKTINLINGAANRPAPALPQQETPQTGTDKLDPQREAMLNDLRNTGYRKERPGDWKAFP